MLQFTDEAVDAWNHIVDSDETLAPALESRLDMIEADPQAGKRRPPWWFTTVRVRGRDDLCAIVWAITDDDPLVGYIGPVSASAG